MYNDEPNIETEIDKDLDKFSEENIIISDSFDKIWFKNDKDNNKKTNLKIFLEQESDIYINKIDNKYKIFCNNHKEIPKIKNKSNINNKNDELIKNQRFLNLKSIYITNEDILLGIPDEYKVQHNEFKTDPDLLSKPVNYLRVKCDGLIKMSTQIDKELEKKDFMNKINVLTKNNQNLDTKKNVLQEKVSNMQSTIEQTEKSIETKNKEIESLKEKEKELKSLNEKIVKSQKIKYETLVGEISEKEKIIQKLNEQLKAKEESIKYFTINDNLEKKYQLNYKNELDQEKEKNKKLENKINNLNKQIDNLYLQNKSEGSLMFLFFFLHWRYLNCPNFHLYSFLFKLFKIF